MKHVVEVSVSDASEIEDMVDMVVVVDVSLEVVIVLEELAVVVVPEEAVLVLVSELEDSVVVVSVVDVVLVVVCVVSLVVDVLVRVVHKLHVRSHRPAYVQVRQNRVSHASAHGSFGPGLRHVASQNCRDFKSSW